MNNERYERLQALLGDIAQELTQATGWHWQVVQDDPPGDWYGRLRTEEEPTEVGERRAPWRLFCSTGNDRGKLEAQQLKISGLWLLAHDGETFYPREAGVGINCAIRRGAKAIAGDIVRRLLPDYEEALEEVARQVVRHEEALARGEQLVERLLTADPQASEFGAHARNRLGTRYHDGKPTWRARLGHDGRTVELTVDYLTPAEAETLVRYIYAWRTMRREIAETEAREEHDYLRAVEENYAQNND